jgi:hypothetical protein
MSTLGAGVAAVTAFMAKLAWVRDPGVPAGQAATGSYRCPCGTTTCGQPFGGPDWTCTCGTTYDGRGWRKGKR